MIKIHHFYLEHFAIPKLRKEIPIIESDFNSIHQLHMMDFIYDQQDLYNHYDECFEMRKFSGVKLRKNDIPFSNLLENYYDHILSEFIIDNDKQTLLNIRWYNLKEYEKEFNLRK